MLIALTQRQDENKHGIKIDNIEKTFLDFLDSFEVVPLLIPNKITFIKKFFKLPFKAIILSGGNDVYLNTFSSSTSSKQTNICEERDEVENKILEYAIKNKIPVLGICRGMQLINVFFGGDLINIKKEGNKIEHVNSTHKIIFKNKLSHKKSAVVNSYHKYGITKKTLSKELNSFAESEDGIIEGISHPKYPIAGIQWHPERKSPDNKINTLLFESFLKHKLFWEK